MKSGISDNFRALNQMLSSQHLPLQQKHDCSYRRGGLYWQLFGGVPQ